MRKEYLGDGVYAEMSNGSLRLTTEDGVSVHNVIWLEPEVIQGFEWYVKRCREERIIPPAPPEVPPEEAPEDLPEIPPVDLPPI